MTSKGPYLQSIVTSLDATVATGGKKAIRYIYALNIAENKTSNTTTGDCVSTDVVKLFIRTGSSSGPILYDIRLTRYFESKELVFPEPLYASDGFYFALSQGTIRGAILGL